MLLIDRYNRSINYLRVSVTDKCNLRCFYCIPQENFKLKRKEEILSYEELIGIIKVATSLGITKVRITGGEPLIRKNIIYLIEEISKLNKVEDFSLTTNGTLLKYYAKALKVAGLKRINISLDSLDNIKFEKITGSSLNDVLAGIEKAKEANFVKIKINVVLLRNINDDEVFNFIEFAKKHNLILRFIEYMPIWDDKKWEKLFISNDEIVERIGSSLKEAEEQIQFISPISNKFCQSCNKLRITADGYILPCLFSRKEINIKDNKYTVEELLLKATSCKPKCSVFRLQNRVMRQIGG